MTVDRSALEWAAPRAAAQPRWHVAVPWRLLTVGLLGADVLAVCTAFALAYLIRFKAGVPFLETPPHELVFYQMVTLWAAPVWLTIFAFYGLYDRQRLFVGFQEYTRIIHASTVGLLFVICMSFVERTLIISRGWLVMTWVFSFVLTCGCRFVLRRVVRQLRRHGHLTSRALVVGTNEEGRALAEQLSGDHGSGTHVLGFVDSTGAEETTIGGLPVLGGLSALRQIVHEEGVAEIVVAPTALSRDELLDLYRLFGHDGGVELRFSSGLFEILTTGIQVKETSCVPLVTPQRVRITGLDAALKLGLDYAVALGALVVLSPLLAVLAVLVRLDSPGPVLHRRRVVGRSGKAFDAFKFRTMVVNADEVLANDPELRRAFESGFKLKTDPRVTRLGRFLRRTSLDELPQLLNVVRGEMSLVGPRMIVPAELGRYGKWGTNLLTVKPGITGPWQVRGRSDIAYEERIRLSMHYIRNYSIWQDLEILLRTIPAILQGTGAY